jgi:hypothetical protein
MLGLIMDLNELDIEVLPLLGALVLVLLAGFGVGPIIQKLTDHIRPENAWKTDVLSAGRSIGQLETVIFTLSIISGNPIFIGGWLAFKVAAKWENWAHVVRLPELKTIDLNSTDFEYRAKFASWLHSRFLIGVLLNILVSVIGAWTYLQFTKIM